MGLNSFSCFRTSLILEPLTKPYFSCKSTPWLNVSELENLRLEKVEFRSNFAHEAMGTTLKEMETAAAFMP